MENVERVESFNRASSGPLKTYSIKKILVNKIAETTLKQASKIIVYAKPVENKQQPSEVKKDENKTSKLSVEVKSRKGPRICKYLTTNISSNKPRKYIRKQLTKKCEKKVSKKPSAKVFTKEKLKTEEKSKIPKEDNVGEPTESASPSNLIKKRTEKPIKCFPHSNVVCLSRDWSASRKTYARNAFSSDRCKSNNIYDSFTERKENNYENVNNYDVCESGTKNINEKISDTSSHVHNSSTEVLPDKNINNCEVDKTEKSVTTMDQISPAETTNNEITNNSAEDDLKLSNTSEKVNSDLSTPSLGKSTPILKSSARKGKQKSVHFADDNGIDLPQNSINKFDILLSTPCDFDSPDEIKCFDKDSDITDVLITPNKMFESNHKIAGDETNPDKEQEASDGKEEKLKKEVNVANKLNNINHCTANKNMLNSKVASTQTDRRIFYALHSVNHTYKRRNEGKPNDIKRRGRQPKEREGKRNNFNQSNCSVTKNPTVYSGVTHRTSNIQHGDCILCNSKYEYKTNNEGECKVAKRGRGRPKKVTNEQQNENLSKAEILTNQIKEQVTIILKGNEEINNSSDKLSVIPEADHKKKNLDNSMINKLEEQKQSINDTTLQPVIRKRGRPRKYTTNETQNIISDEISDIIEQQSLPCLQTSDIQDRIKKHSLEDSNANCSAAKKLKMDISDELQYTAAEQQPVRKRGRPRKYTIDNEDDDSLVSENSKLGTLESINNKSSNEMVHSEIEIKSKGNLESFTSLGKTSHNLENKRVNLISDSNAVETTMKLSENETESELNNSETLDKVSENETLNEMSENKISPKREQPAQIGNSAKKGFSGGVHYINEDEDPKNTFSCTEKLLQNETIKKHARADRKRYDTVLYDERDENFIDDKPCTALKRGRAVKKNPVGRPRRINKNDDNTEKENFECGTCKMVFSTIGKIKYHILSAHNGLARINDDTPFSKEEELDMLKRTMKVLKKLTCQQPDCGKKFSTILGYRYHKDLCGMEVEKTECDVCGKNVKKLYLPMHLRKHSERREKFVGEINTELPPRGAAIKAIKRMENFINAQKDIPGESFSSDEDDNEEYQLSEQQEADENFEDDEEFISSEEEPLDKESGFFFIELLDPWKGLFSTPFDQYKEILENLTKKWESLILENGKVVCEKQSCRKEFESISEIKLHWNECGIYLVKSKWTCKICGNSYTVGPSHLYSHMKKKHSKLKFMEDYNDEPPDNVQNLSSTFSGDHRYLKPYLPAMELTLKFYQKNNRSEVFSKWKPLISEWHQMNERAYEDYLPPIKESPFFKLSPEKEPNEWEKLKLFSSPQTEDISSQTLFFVGGAVWGAAWCPTPAGVKANQILALAACNPAEHSLINVSKQKGMIQFWNVGNLENIKLEKTPTFTLGISHENGEIWDMVWCPSGCWEDISDLQGNSKKINEVLPRLGLLAVACNDSTVKIYSVPHPEFLPKKEDILPVFKTKPIVVLIPPKNGPNTICHQTVCTKVAWQKTSGHPCVAAGYGSGLVCLWNLVSSVSLLTIQNAGQLILQPYISFPAHGGCITALLWLPIPENRYLATASYDRSVKVWDLQDHYWPSMIMKRGITRDLAWLPHWCGVFGAMDDCYNLFNTATFYKECGYYNYVIRLLTPHFGCIWSLSVSDWLNIEVSGDSGGEVVMTVLCQLMKCVDNIKQISHRHVPVFRMTMEPLNDEPENNKNNTMEDASNKVTTSNVESCNSELEENVQLKEQKSENKNEKDNSTEEDKKLGSVPAYEETVKTTGLVFHDSNIENFTLISEREFRRIVRPDTMSPARPDRYPLNSVNKVAWNPNLGSNLWLFSAGQAGIVKLSCVSGLNSKEVKSMLLKCKEACRTHTKDL